MMSEAPSPITTQSVFCPACGYDLRAKPAGPCPECGHVPDPEALRISGIPWAHRRRIGRVRAYLRTVRLVTFGGPALALEHARPQEPADARAFHRVHASLVAVMFLALLALAIASTRYGWAILAVQPDLRVF